MPTNKVYSCVWSDVVVLSGAGYASNVRIQSVGRIMKIKSITLEWMAYNNTTGLYVSTSNTTDQALQLIADPGGNKIAHAFLIGANPPSNNGDQLRWYRPGQWLFDSFFINNDILFSMQISNADAANDYTHNVALIVETEEKTVFL